MLNGKGSTAGMQHAQQALCDCGSRLTCTSGCNTHTTGKLPSICKLVLVTKTKEHLLLTEVVAEEVLGEDGVVRSS